MEKLTSDQMFVSTQVDIEKREKLLNTLLKEFPVIEGIQEQQDHYIMIDALEQSLSILYDFRGKLINVLMNKFVS